MTIINARLNPIITYIFFNLLTFQTQKLTMYFIAIARLSSFALSVELYAIRLSHDLIAMISLTSPIVIKLPTGASLAVETKGLLFLWL